MRFTIQNSERLVSFGYCNHYTAVCACHPGLLQPQKIFRICYAHGRFLTAAHSLTKRPKNFYCFTTSQQQTQLSKYKHDTSKSSNGIPRPECASPLKLHLLKLKSTTSGKYFNILKQNQYLKRLKKKKQNLLSNLLPYV